MLVVKVWRPEDIAMYGKIGPLSLQPMGFRFMVWEVGGELRLYRAVQHTNKRHLPSTTLVSVSRWTERPGIGRRAVPEPGRHDHERQQVVPKPGRLAWIRVNGGRSGWTSPAGEVGRTLPDQDQQGGWKPL